MPSRRSIWDNGEEIAASYLEWRWYEIIARNYQIKGWEIDIIARDGEWTVFVEVRYRQDELHGHPLDTFGISKRKALKRTAFFYVHKHKIDPEYIRIDFIGIMPDANGKNEIWHIEWVEV